MAKKKKNRDNKAKDATEYLVSAQHIYDDIHEKINYRFDKRGYDEQIKTFVKTSIKERRDDDHIRKLSAFDICEEFKTAEPYQRRRTDALIKYLPIISEKFKDSYPDMALESAIIEMLSYPSTNLPDTIRVHGDACNPLVITLAIAIFILDDLSYNKNIYEALLYIPNTKDEIDSVFLPDDNMNDSLFSTDVMRGMVHLIINRDNIDSNHIYLNKTTAERRQRSEITHRKAVIDKEIYMSDDENDVAKLNQIRKRVDKMSYRERFDTILSLMSPTAISCAQNRFENEIYAFIDTALSAVKPYFDNINNACTKLLDCAKRLKTTFLEYETLADESEKRARNLANRSKQSYKNVMLPFNAPAENNLASIANLTHEIIGDSEAAYLEYAKAHYEAADAHADFSRECLDFKKATTYVVNTYGFEKDNIDSEILLDMIDKTKSFSVKNPFETCFAYLWMLESGHDLIWLVEITAALLGIAVQQLPWGKCINNPVTRDDDPKEAHKDEKLTETDNIDYTDYSDEESRLYQQKYNNRWEWLLLGIDEPATENLLPLNIAQLCYMTSNTLLPRKIDTYFDGFDKMLIDSGIAPTNADLLHLFIETHGCSMNKIEFRDFDNDTENNENVTTEELKKTLSEKTELISDLKRELHAIQKQLKEKQETISKIKENAELEHDELVELRELAYKLQNNTDDNSITTNDKPIELPYAVTSNIVVFGGHATWLKAIKPLLPGIRFIDPNTNPDTNLIRNADVVWIQSNAVPHSYYYKIMDIVRQRKVPVKYFAYASAEKCAIQLVEHDIAINKKRSS